MKLRRHLLAGVLAIAAGQASAADFVEGADFPSALDFPGFNVGALDPGRNTVSGGLSWTCAQTCGGQNGIQGDYSDNFTFTLAGGGGVIESFAVATSEATVPENFQADLVISIATPQGIFPIGGINGIPVNGSGLPVALTGPNLLPGATYLASLYVTSGSAITPSSGYSLRYEITFIASNVPEPGSFGLLAVGLAALAGLRRAARPWRRQIG